MLGRGCPEDKSYMDVLRNQYGIKSEVYAEDLVGIRLAIFAINEIPNDSTLVLQIGAGDQIRMISAKIGKWLPGNRGKSKTILDQPLYQSKKRIRRIFNEIKSYIKYLLKSHIIKTAIYKQAVSLQDFQEYLRDLASIAKRKKIRVIWVSTVKGFYRVPEFLKVEKDYYSGYEAYKEFNSENQFDSCFLDLESFILESDTGFDGFHLNQEGHVKLAKELVKLLR